MRVVGGDRAVVGARQDVLDAQPELGVVAVARQVDEAGDEALERIAAGEEGDALALLQMQDAEGDVVELVLGDLEQLVARVGLEDVGEGLAVVAGRREAGARQAVGDLLAEQRNLARILAVGAGGEQADEELLADDVAGGVELLHADGVHVHGPMHGRAAVGLGDHEHPRLAQELPHVRRQLLEIAQAVEHRILLVAQDAEAGLRRDRDRGGVVVAEEIVFAIAEIGEVVVVEPFEEGLGLRHLVGRQAGRRRVQRGEDLLGAGAHLPPVGGRGADIRQHLLEQVLDLGQRVRRRLLVDADLHLGFGDLLALARDARLPAAIAHDADDRMDDEIDREVALVERGGQRIHQEGHVVVDHLDDGVGAVPALLVEARIVDAHLGRARRAAGRRRSRARGRRHRDCPATSLARSSMATLA